MSGAGRVITFYSYKGGTGRTMAMANTAWILASNGYRVVVIDWDLEAPGLHRFLAPALADPDQKTTTGLMDFLMEYVRAATRGSTEDASEPWYEPYTSIMRFVQPVNTGFARGRLDMIGAGRQNDEYAERVNLFDWRSFYERFQGRGFLDAVFAKLREKYDFILIDSRTGVSDTSGICTVHLPDALVVMFTLNVQSIEGASAVALDARRQRDNRLEVYPVPTRIEVSELDRLQAARVVARARFAPIVKGLDTTATDYLVAMEVPHVAYYLYGEQLAAVVEGGRAPVLLGRYEKLAAYVSGGKVTQLGLLPDKELDAARARFRSGGAPGGVPIKASAVSKRYDVFLSYARRDEAVALRIREELRNLMSVFVPTQDIKPGESFHQAIREAIASSAAVVALFTDTRAVTESSWAEIETALARELDVPVIPVLLDAAQPPVSLGDVVTIRARASEPGHVAEQIRIAMLASDRDGHNANERIAYLYSERNKLQRDAKRRGLYVTLAFALLAATATTSFFVLRLAASQNLESSEARVASASSELRELQHKLDALDASTRKNNADLVGKLQLVDSQLLQAGDRLAEVQRTLPLRLPPDVDAAVKLAAATQESLHSSVQDAAKQAGATRPVEVRPMVLVFAPPGETEKPEVQDAATTLETAGFLLGTKRVFSLRPPDGVSEVRFFRNPEDRDEANKILRILTTSAQLSKGRISFVVDPDIKRRRYFEVHFTKTAIVTKSKAGLIDR